MKKLLILIVTAIGIFGCNKNPDFADFEYTSVYFPLQTPVRTLILGEYTSDNSLDNKLQFNMGAAIGGRRENNQDEWYQFQIMESLIDGFVFSTGDSLKVLPTKYYTTSPASGERVTIPRGSMEGKILVSLTQEFLSDPNSYKNRYVIPLLITDKSVGIDTILQGNAAVQNPNVLIPANWNKVPKSYTLFGIKYVNEYHGNYLHYGLDYTLDAAGNKLANPVKYSTYFVEQNSLWMLSTVGKNIVETSGVANAVGVNKMRLTINADNSVAIAPVTGAVKVVDGSKSTGKFVKKGGKWGGVNYDAIFLNYYYTEKTVQHQVMDTLVFRDKAVIFETFTVKKK